MRVLFVGATGVIGRRVVPLLADRFDLKLAARRPDEAAGLPLETGDITDFAQCRRMVQDADAVVNCAIARYTRPDGSPLRLDDLDERMAYNKDGIEINVRGAYHLYEAAWRAGIGKFVFIGSMTVWMGKPDYPRVAADTPRRPREFYACTKLFGENLGRVYAVNHGMQVLCLHLGQPYPIDHPQEPEWLADPRTRGVMVAIGDIAQAIECALNAPEPAFAAYPIVSASDAPWIDTSSAQEIGYRPRFFFTQEGMSSRP
jgi:uronate dehydrogenase